MKCGDQCIGQDAKCLCDYNEFRPSYTHQQCCIPSGETCTRQEGLFGDDGFCSEGRTLSMSSYCENTDRSLQCYNSYQDSQVIGDQSHYTCPNSCVPWLDMCRGVSWCEGDHEVCGPDLRCPPWYHDEDDHLHYVTTHSLTSPLLPDHRYCFVEDQSNNQMYDSIDRSDETEVQRDDFAIDLDISSFTPCNTSHQSGVMCGSECILS